MRSMTRPHTSTLKRLGSRILYYRKKRKLTQEELAFRVEISTSYLSCIEHGKRNPSIELLLKTADVLHINVEELFK